MILAGVLQFKQLFHYNFLYKKRQILCIKAWHIARHDWREVLINFEFKKKYLVKPPIGRPSLIYTIAQNLNFENLHLLY